MLYNTLLLVVLLTLLGRITNVLNTPRDTSQPDSCDPNGRCNVGQPTIRKLIVNDIRQSSLTPEVKESLLGDFGEGL